MKPSAFINLSIAFLISASSTFAAEPGEPGGLPPDAEHARAVLNHSPRHGEWVDIPVAGHKTPLRAYIVYPERSDKAPAVMVIHEIFGESDWVRGVVDQLAADGFIAIAPDMLSGHGPGGGGTDSLGDQQQVVAAIYGVRPPEVMADLNATRDYVRKLPAADGRVATVGFCWGGGQSFAYAVAQPDLSAAVVYYGVPPTVDEMSNIHAPVLGLYGGADARISSTVSPTTTEMKKAGKSYTAHIYAGAGHGFMRDQSGKNGANLKAAQQAWPATIAFLRENLK